MDFYPFLLWIVTYHLMSIHEYPVTLQGIISEKNMQKECDHLMVVVHCGNVAKL